MRRLQALAVLVAGATVTLAVLDVLALAGVVHAADLDGAPAWIAPFIVLATLTPALVGLLIALRRPRNRIAWILLAGSLTTMPVPAIGLSDGWALQSGRATWPLLYAWPLAVAYVFPDGRFLSRRWRLTGLAVAGCFLAFMALAMLDPTPFGDGETTPNPMAGNAVGQAIVDSGIWFVFWSGILAGLFAGALCVYLRLRRTSGVERLQVLWLAWAACLIPLGLVLCAASWLVVSAAGAAVFPFLLAMEAAVAIAVGIAVARYRLYAIERLVNRTLVYATLTLLLGVTYVAVALGLGVLLGRGSAPVAAAATLAVAIAFRPLRARVQRAVDRRFDRRRFDAVGRVQAFEDGVRAGSRGPEEIGAELAAAFGDAGAELLFWLPASEAFAGPDGAIVARPPDDGRARTPVRRNGRLTALLLHDPVLEARPALLDGVLSAAGLSIEIARLQVEVRRQLAEVEASRRRIVEAGYEERRRLERDLHDGAQQRLVTLGIVLRRLQRSLPSEALLLAPALDAAVEEVSAALRDLRTIAAGVRPPRLDDGLAAALRDLARTAPLPVAVEAAEERLAASVEAAAYFVACEGLTNAVKHAAASRVALRAVRSNGSLLVSVADDGVGGAVARRGSGLAGMRDRVAAHGGSLHIESGPGAGTRIEAAIPCA